MSVIKPFSRQVVIAHLRKIQQTTPDGLDYEMLEAAIRELEPKKCFECGHEVILFCPQCNDPLAGFEKITDVHKDGRRLALASENQRWNEPFRYGFWNARASRWEVEPTEGECPVLYGDWVFTHARAA
jgi:hypothetical protein